MRSSQVSAWIVVALGACVAAPALAGGLGITPAIIEHTATPGEIGAVTVTNGTPAVLRMTVTPRRWRQARDGHVSPDRRSTLSSQIATSARTFTLAPGARRAITLTSRRSPPRGSLYGAIEVVGIPPAPRRRGALTVAYRLVASLRLNPTPARRRLDLRVGAGRISGRGAAARPSVAVRNAGNTVDAVSGSARISGSSGVQQATATAIRVLPGATVDLPLTVRRRLPRGNYRVALTLRQAGRVVTTTTRTLRVR